MAEHGDPAIEVVERRVRQPSAEQCAAHDPGCLACVAELFVDEVDAHRSVGRLAELLDLVVADPEVVLACPIGELVDASMSAASVRARQMRSQSDLLVDEVRGVAAREGGAQLFEVDAPVAAAAGIGLLLALGLWPVERGEVARFGLAEPGVERAHPDGLQDEPEAPTRPAMTGSPHAVIAWRKAV